MTPEFKVSISTQSEVSLDNNLTLVSSAQSSIQDTPNFSNFSRLPTELRLWIWELAMPATRILEINWVGSEYCYYERPMTYLQSQNPHPVLLFVNRESRTETLRKYKMIHGPSGFCLAFDPHKDIIYETKKFISGEDGNIDMPITFPENNWWHWSPQNLNPISCTPDSKIRRLAIHQTRLLEILSRLRESREKTAWDELDELCIIVRDSEGDKEMIGAANREKILEFGEMVPEDGTWEWGRPRILNRLMEILIGLYEVSGRAPVIKVVKLVRKSEMDQSPFCYRKVRESGL